MTILDKEEPEEEQHQKDSVGEGEGALSEGDGETKGKQDNLIKEDLYKTELCKKWMSNGSCRYAGKCRFAHGYDDLRVVVRHPLYKTSMCKSFEATGTCRYGSRCRFIHDESEEYLSQLPRGVATLNIAPEAEPGVFPRVPSAPANLNSYHISPSRGPYPPQQFASQEFLAQMPSHGSSHSLVHHSSAGLGDSPVRRGRVMAQQPQQPRAHVVKGSLNYGRVSASAVNLSSLNQPGRGFPATFEDFQTERQSNSKTIRPPGLGGTMDTMGIEEGMGNLFIGFTPQMDARQIPVASSSSSSLSAMRYGNGSPPSPPLSPPLVAESRKTHSESDAELKASASAVALSTLASPDSLHPSSPSRLGGFGGLPSFEDMSSLSLPPPQMAMNKSASQPALHYSHQLQAQQSFHPHSQQYLPSHQPHHLSQHSQQVRFNDNGFRKSSQHNYEYMQNGSVGLDTHLYESGHEGYASSSPSLLDMDTRGPSFFHHGDVHGLNALQHQRHQDAMRKAASVNELSSAAFRGGSLYEHQHHGSNGNFGFFLHSTQEEDEDAEGLFY